MTLEPGDIVATGTPAGVGSAREPRVWLADGDEIVVELADPGRARDPDRRLGAAAEPARRGGARSGRNAAAAAARR